MIPPKFRRWLPIWTNSLKPLPRSKPAARATTYTVGTGGELFTPFLSNRAQPWIVDGKLVIDPKIVEYVHFAKHDARQRL